MFGLGTLKAEAYAWVDEASARVPGELGILLRRAVHGRRFAAVGRRFRCEPAAVVYCHHNIRLGDDVRIGRGNTLAADGTSECRIGNRTVFGPNVIVDAGPNGRIAIGNDVAIAANTVLRAANHVFKDPDVPFAKQGHAGGEILIGDDVWIAVNCVILPGTTIGAGCVVMAGCVVSGAFGPRSIIGGNPARVVGRRGRPTAAEVEARRLARASEAVDPAG